MKDLLFDTQRATSLLARCTYCSQEPGNPCVNPRTQQPIEQQAAHFARIKAGELLASTRRVDEPTTPPRPIIDRPPYGTGGWYPAQNSGRCAACGKRYEPGTHVLAISAHHLRAECCADAS